MARPKKATVDYFPHQTEHGKTLFILQNRWGNDGYATWFKILERLGSSDNHVIDCNDRATVMHLSAYCLVDEPTLFSILEFLAEVCAIHPGFWRGKYIYSENFVSGITDAYRKRMNSLPTVEKVSGVINIDLSEFPAEETPTNRVNDAGSTEREREREREIKTPPTPSRMTLFEIRSAFREKTGVEPGGGVNQNLTEICQTYTRESIESALLATGTRVPKPTNPLKYAKRFPSSKRKMSPENGRTGEPPILIKRLSI